MAAQPLQPVPSVRPVLRGYVHLVAALVMPFATVALLTQAHSARSAVAALVFGVGMGALFVTSSAYHLVGWHTRFRAGFRRFDHSMIFVAVACAYTPFCLQVLDRRSGAALLALVWAIAVAGVVMKQAFSEVPRWANLAAYLLIGWAGLLAAPPLVRGLGPSSLSLVLLAGTMFTLGAVIYTMRWPNPVPRVAGHHELFHLLVTAGWALLYVVVFSDVLPR